MTRKKAPHEPLGLPPKALLSRVLFAALTRFAIRYGVPRYPRIAGIPGSRVSCPARSRACPSELFEALKVAPFSSADENGATFRNSQAALTRRAIRYGAARGQGQACRKASPRSGCSSGLAPGYLGTRVCPSSQACPGPGYTRGPGYSRVAGYLRVLGLPGVLGIPG
jgi:hypothetical protein